VEAKLHAYTEFASRPFTMTDADDAARTKPYVQVVSHESFGQRYQHFDRRADRERKIAQEKAPVAEMFSVSAARCASKEFSGRINSRTRRRKRRDWRSGIFLSLMTGALKIVNPDSLWISSHLWKKTAVHLMEPVASTSVAWTGIKKVPSIQSASFSSTTNPA
jgi:hypothetical protein